MTEEQPDTEPSIPTDALDWSQVFDKRFRETFQTEFHNLPEKSSEEDFHRAATRAFVLTLRESGLSRETLLKFLEEAMRRTTSQTLQVWTEARNKRRSELIAKKFQDAITVKEQFELRALTCAMRAALDTEENVPFSGAQKLYSKLLKMDDDD